MRFHGVGPLSFRSASRHCCGERYVTHQPDIPVKTLRSAAALTTDVVTLKLWFSSRAQAESHAREHDDDVNDIGTQAVVFGAR